ncbi:outer membrane lipoprotein-sorting protein [Agaribacterium haliotis]|uniref:outer membrane lipoprotein-sorting protein n=1 Tax=Agaribacterium haliotis TaxID=2013869 RepID=UPI000BB550F3|nr:outer membrane lipoprotein-sorting protein [Agaribacterium haliotis]
MKLKMFVNAALFAGLALNQAWAAAPADVSPEAAARGLEIAKEVVRRDDGWGDSKVSMQMILTNKHGDTSERQIRLQSLEVDGDGDKSLSIFDEPRDVKGTAFLSFTHATVPDEQWLYLPALKRVKRISSANKSGPFMGSEYAFEDLTSFEVEKYDYEFLREDTYDGQDVFVIRTFPRYPKSGYTKLEVVIDQAEYRTLKIDFYDRKGDLLKTLENKAYKQYLDKYWRAHNALMVNHQSGKKTELIWSGYDFQTGLSDKDFNKNSLKRAK